ncbi:MAG: serine hydrolase domain-containing protein [Promethearchaeota archaeon]
MKNKRLILIALLLSLSIPSLMAPASVQATNPTQNRSPAYWPTGGWLTATPESQGVSSAVLQEIRDYYTAYNWPIDSMLVIRNGYIVYEDYPSPIYGQNTAHVMYSCTKSVSSALTGIAISLGLYDLDDLVLDFFPGYTFDNLDAWKEAITVENLLMMRSGIPWDESTYPYGDINNDVTAMVASPDAVQFVLDKPMESQPGTAWNYNTGASHLLSAIITGESGMSTVAFADQHLFGPLGITTRLWGVDQQGICWGGHDLHLRPRDMAKFGFLYLNNGNWDGQQIVPADWVATSTDELTQLSTRQAYGYQWWIDMGVDSYSARGYQGQYIFVYPDSNLIVVITASDVNGVIGYYDIADLIDELIDSLFYVPPGISPLVIGVIVITIGVCVTITIFYFVRRRK